MSQPDQAHSSFQILRPRIPILRISTGTRRANHRVACIIEIAHNCFCLGMWQYMIIQQSSPSESHCIEILEHGTRQSCRTNHLPLLTCLGEIQVCQRDFLSQNGYGEGSSLPVHCQTGNINNWLENRSVTHMNVAILLTLDLFTESLLLIF